MNHVAVVRRSDLADPTRYACRSLAHHRAREAGETMLVTRQAAIVFGIPTTVEYLRKQVRPIACDVSSRAVLYDLAELDTRFTARRAS